MQHSTLRELRIREIARERYREWGALTSRFPGVDRYRLAEWFLVDSRWQGTISQGLIDQLIAEFINLDRQITSTDQERLEILAASLRGRIKPGGTRFVAVLERAVQQEFANDAPSPRRLEFLTNTLRHLITERGA